MKLNVTPNDLKSNLQSLVEGENQTAAMIWGPPGIGKSSVVAQIAEEQSLNLVDLRLGQLAPTDLRGLPTADHDEASAKWLAPEFLPREGRGILFLDELTNAPRTMQGLAQQLILSRRIGSYTLPDDWFVWAAGNRPEDRAAVHEMPSPVANRFLHFQCQPDLESLKSYALRKGWSEEVVAFLSYRPGLLFEAPETGLHAWPSPRTWEMANQLYEQGMTVAPTVGDGPSREFEAFVDIYRDLPDLETVLCHGVDGEGRDSPPEFPTEMSERYAVTVGLAYRADSATQVRNAFVWLYLADQPEFLRCFVADVIRRFRRNEDLDVLYRKLEGDAIWEDFRSIVEETLL